MNVLFMWLQEGESLGQSAQEAVDGTPNQEAVRRRKLPESATRLHPKPEVPPQKRVRMLNDSIQERMLKC